MQATHEYHKLLQYILDNGKKKNDRTSTGTTSIFDYKIKFDMSQGFPLITTKRLHTKSIIHELLWFLKGSTNTKYLNENGVTIWDEWADSKGDLGRIYGAQWVNWGGIKETPRIGWLHKREDVWCVKWSDLHSFGEGTHWSYTDISSFNQSKYNDSDEGRKVTFTTTTIGHDPESFTPNIVATVNDNPTIKYRDGINQIQNAIDKLNNNPDSRRIMVVAYNVGEIEQMALPPCHWAFELYTEELTDSERFELFKNDSTVKVPDRRLHLKWHQRSVDTFLGLPFNIASYALLLHMFAQQTNMVPGTLVGDLTNVHIYDNHMEYVKKQLDRPYYKYNAPKLTMNKVDSIFDYTFNDIGIRDYEYFPNWRNVPIAV